MNTKSRKKDSKITLKISKEKNLNFILFSLFWPTRICFTPHWWLINIFSTFFAIFSLCLLFLRMWLALFRNWFLIGIKEYSYIEVPKIFLFAYRVYAICLLFIYRNLARYENKVILQVFLNYQYKLHLLSQFQLFCCYIFPFG